MAKVMQTYISRAGIPTQVCLTLPQACNHQPPPPPPSAWLGKEEMGEGQVTHPGLGPTASCLRMGWRSHSGRRWPPSGLTPATEVAQRVLLEGQSASTPSGHSPAWHAPACSQAKGPGAGGHFQLSRLATAWRSGPNFFPGADHAWSECVASRWTC